MRTKFTFMTLLFVVLAVLAGLTVAQDSPFTIQADEDLRPIIDMVYMAATHMSMPTYVESGGDLLITSDPDALADATDTLPDYLLPDVGMVITTDNVEAASFVEYAVGPDGQQVLIDDGLLPDSVTITDQAGNEITIPQPVRSAITPHSIATYTVYGVGAGDRLLAGAFLGARDEPGASRMAMIDPRFSEINSSTMTQREINVEEVAVLAPDVILTSTRSQWLDAVAELEIPVILFEGETPEALKDAVGIVGQIFGPNTAAQADAWIAYYDAVFETVTNATADLDERPAVLFTGEEPLRVASGDMYQTSMIQAAGGVSVSQELTGFWNDVNLEQVVVWNPDVIFTVPYGGASVEAFTGSAEWQVVNAVTSEQVYQMPSYVAPWDTPIPESVLGIIWMADTLYPDLVDLDCATETDYFYRTFYEYELADDEIAALCGTQ